jgi:hypothetical protein
VQVGRGSKIFIFAWVFLAASALFLPPANAYLDPGTGSFIFQALIGALLAVALAVKVMWRRLVGFVTRRGRTAEDS